MIRLDALTPDKHQLHGLHKGETDWAETNCYIDLWIELLTALKVEPLACLGFTLCSDFEGDQWTFFKPHHANLRRLYGLQVEELSLWCSVLEHCVEHVALGRIPLVEADSYYLPDTRATDYRTNHVKTTIAPTYIDASARELRYFHNAGFFSLSGEDFDGLFRFEGRDGRADDVSSGKARWLPPYCEIVKLERLARRSKGELREISWSLAREHYAWRPSSNPFARFQESWPGHLARLLEGELETYHGYTFSMLRQCGANYFMLSAFLKWHAQGQTPEFVESAEAAAQSFAAISQTCKAMLMKLARVVHSKRSRDFSEQLAEMAGHWQRGMELLAPALGAG